MNAKRYFPLACIDSALGRRCYGDSCPADRMASDAGNRLMFQKSEMDVGGNKKSEWTLWNVLRVLLCAFAVILLLPAALAAETGIVWEGYDNNAAGFVTRYQENYSIVAGVPNGMFTTSEVLVRCLSGRVSTVYRNGKPFEPERLNESYRFHQVGAYTIVISDASDAGLPSRVFTFRIVDQKTADISIYFLPECVNIYDIQRDKKTLDSAEARMLDLRTEGDYWITWQVGNSIYQYLTFHNYPELPLFAVEEEEYSAKLNFDVGLDRVMVYRDGEKEGLPIYSAENGMWDEEKGYWRLTRTDENQEAVAERSISLSEAGTYTVLAYGENGEGKLEQVTVRKKHDVAGFFAVVFLAALGVVLRIFFLREKKTGLSVR